MTSEQFIQTCRDVCPHCKADVIVRWRDDSREYVHDIYRGTAVTHAFCLASHFRIKYKEVNGG